MPTIADKLTQIAENTQYVYDRGYNNGFNIGYDKATHDYFYTFWDNFQQYGERENYNYGFGGAGWTNETFTPQYDIRPTAFARAFAFSGIEGSLKEILEKQGVVLDTSNLAYCEYVFDGASKITEVPHLVGNNSFAGVFSKAVSLVTASLEPKEKTTFDASFHNCYELTNLTITGVVGNNIDLSPCKKLSKASITSVINALSTSVSGKTLTLSTTAKNNAFTASEWSALIATKTNWTISLV